MVDGMMPLPFPLMDGVESGVIAFILSGMGWSTIDRVVGLHVWTLGFSILATTLLIGAVLLYIDHRSIDGRSLLG